MLHAANADRDLQKLLYAQCQNDILFWFDNFVWATDPREITAKMPMILFPRQREMVLWLQEREANREGGLVEKSRDFGATVICSGYAIHGWLFREGFRAGFGSRKLEYVDNSEDDKTIFAKLRFTLDNLPWWMKPAPANYLSKYCLLKNFDRDNSISGEGGASIGRGDRTSLYFVDEAAFLERPHLVDAALSQTTNTRFDISTPNGLGNSFYKKRHGGKTPVFSCHWKQDSRKNHWLIEDADKNVIARGNGDIDVAVPEGCRAYYPWYEKQVNELNDPVVIAQEIDIDYAASVEGICIPAAHVRAAVNLHLRIEIPQNGALRASADLAGGGANQNVVGFMRGLVLQDDIEAWRNPSSNYNATKIKNLCEAREAASLCYDAGGGYGAAVADMARDADNPPRFKVRALHGNDSPSLTEWPEKGDNGHRKTSRDKFVNGRAERWWMLRERFRKAWETVEGHKEYPLDELISIPNHAELIADLSKPLVVSSGTTGKLGIESKEKMKERGVESPDFGDMLAQLMAPKSADEALDDLRDRLKAQAAKNTAPKSVDEALNGLRERVRALNTPKS
jgi:hypothetical protein